MSGTRSPRPIRRPPRNRQQIFSPPLFSYAYELPIFYPLCFDIHPCNGGYGPPHTLRSLRSVTAHSSAQKAAFANPLFSMCCALFHFPYPVSPVFATLTKTAGCVPTIPRMELISLPASSEIGFPLSHSIESPRRTTMRADAHRSEASR